MKITALKTKNVNKKRKYHLFYRNLSANAIECLSIFQNDGTWSTSKHTRVAQSHSR